MKKRTILLVLLFVLFIGIKPDNLLAEASCDSYKTTEAKEACKKIEEYCLQGTKPTKGCIYDPNDSKYTKVVDEEDCYGNNCAKMSGTLTRGYQAIDSDGNAVFAGCYKIAYGGNGKNGNGKSGNDGPTSRYAAGTYFVFKILSPGSNCKQKDGLTDIVPPNKIDGYKGNNSIGTDNATYKWTAKDGGECPLFFGLTGNTTIWTSDKNSFVFADNANDLKLDKKQFRILFWNSQEYETLTGCTVQDKAGYDKAVACYDEAITKIKSKSCPSDMSDISQYQSELNGLANKCSSELEVLYSVDYLKANAATFSSNLKKAANEKLTSCQYQNCKLTENNIASLTNVLSTKTCKNGCSGKSGTEYDSCISCLKGAFNSCGLTSTQIQCLVDSQKKKDDATEQLGEQIEQEQEQHVQEELEESQQILQQVYGQYTGTAEVQDPEIPTEDPGLTECKKILGPNLSAIVKVSITILQIVGAIIAIVKGMMTLIPPVLAHDADALKKASNILVKMAIILVVIFLMKPLLRFIGNLLDFDISCLV